MSNTLAEALAANQLELPAEQVARLDRYCQLLWHKNEGLNLTRHVTYTQFVNRDLWDSLELAKLLKPNEEILDVGSGGGVPGIVLGILRPDLTITLSESVGKKANFLRDLCQGMKLPITVENRRAEDVLEDERFDTVTARGVGPLAKLFRWFEPHWIHMRRLLAIKGPKWRDERLEAESQRLMKYLVLKIAARYPVPGEAWESVILEISRSA